MNNIEVKNNFEEERKVEKGLNDIINNAGFIEIKSIEELDLSPEQTKEAENLIGDHIHSRFFVSELDDGTKVKVIVFEGKNTFDAHIFSPKGHLFSNDFSLDELKANLLLTKSDIKHENN